MRTLGIQIWLGTLLIVLCLGNVAAVRGESDPAKQRMKAQLIWCTDQPKPADDKTVKDVDAKLLEKLNKLNLFKWKNFFEMDKQCFNLPKLGSNITSLSHNCVIEVTHLGDCHFEVKLYGEGKLVQTIRHPLPMGEYLIIAGDIKKKNDEIWIVAISRENPDKSSEKDSDKH